MPKNVIHCFAHNVANIDIQLMELHFDTGSKRFTAELRKSEVLDVCVRIACMARPYR